MSRAAPMPPGSPGGSFTWQAGGFHEQGEQRTPVC